MVRLEGRQTHPLDRADRAASDCSNQATERRMPIRRRLRSTVVGCAKRAADATMASSAESRLRMDPNDDLWTAIRRVLPDADALTAAVAAELGEPAEDVRASVLIGTIAMNGQLGPEAAAVAAIEAELARRRACRSARSARAHSRRSRRWPTCSPRPRRSRPRGRSTSRRSWRSSARPGRSRRGPTAAWSCCCTATRSPAG